MARPTFTCCGQECEVPRFLDLRGLLSFWLLWELRNGPLNGAQLAAALEWRRGDAPSPGTLYPALAALEKAGAVRKRRSGRVTTYDLCPRGASELACARAYLQVTLRDVVQNSRETTR